MSDPVPPHTLQWDDLRLVLAIVEQRTLSAAAAALQISHPTLSRRLQQAERRLGSRLFERRPTQWQLTPAGAELCELARRWREDIGAVERRIAGRDASDPSPVRLTAPDAVAEYLLPGILAEVCREQAGLKIDLLVANQVLSLAQRAADVALRVTDQPTETLRGRRVGTVAMAVYASSLLWRDDAGTAGAAVDATAEASSAGLPWVGFDSALACSGPGRWIDRHVAEADVRLRANTLLGAAQAARAGIGCALLPCFVGASVPGLRRLGTPLPELALPLWLLVHPDLAHQPRIRRATEALARRLHAAAPLLAGDVTG